MQYWEIKPTGTNFFPATTVPACYYLLISLSNVKTLSANWDLSRFSFEAAFWWSSWFIPAAQSLALNDVPQQKCQTLQHIFLCPASRSNVPSFGDKLFIVWLRVIIKRQGHVDTLVWAKSFDLCTLLKELRADGCTFMSQSIMANIQGPNGRNTGDKKNHAKSFINRQPNMNKLHKQKSQPTRTDTVCVGS